MYDWMFKYSKNLNHEFNIFEYDIMVIKSQHHHIPILYNNNNQFTKYYYVESSGTLFINSIFR